MIYTHPEAERYVTKTLQYIKERGCKAGLAINPDTSIEAIEEMLYAVDYILVMSVYPGFAGQHYIPSTKSKIERLVQLKSTYSYKILMDGACSPQLIQEFSEAGVDGFILGTSALFNSRQDYKKTFSELRNL